mmetsp:Transcript_9973/g.28349  ORF Transcript_9973/g.28349 Transcript_9973/m.28349 type:complete len:236 (+) Transcript_9973:527-1234(+)
MGMEGGAQQNPSPFVRTNTALAAGQSTQRNHLWPTGFAQPAPVFPGEQAPSQPSPFSTALQQQQKQQLSFLAPPSASQGTGTGWPGTSSAPMSSPLAPSSFPGQPQHQLPAPSMPYQPAAGIPSGPSLVAPTSSVAAPASSISSSLQAAVAHAPPPMPSSTRAENVPRASASAAAPIEEPPQLFSGTWPPACMACSSSPRTHAVAACRHRTVCGGCARTLRACPLCAEPSATRQQ